MLTNFLIFFFVIVVTGLFAWLAVRAFRSRKTWVKLAGGIPAGLLTLVLLAVVGISARGLYGLYRSYGADAPDIQVERTPERVARGEHLASVVCAGCHSADGELPLAGGNNISDDTGLPLGDIYGRNLTPAGEVAGFTDGQIIRVVREGVHPSGRRLLMGNGGVMHLSDEDLYSIVAYLRTQPAVESEPPETRPSYLLALLLGTNLFKYNSLPADVAVNAPVKAETADYGEYLVTLADCRDCHGPDLKGGKPPAPPGPSLDGVLEWTQVEFIQAMRTGFRPDQTVMLPPMPWRTIGHLDDVELTAIYRYITGQGVSASQ